MPDILSIIARYGYLSLFSALLAEAIGLPVPGALALLAAGAAASAGVLHPALAFGVIVAMCETVSPGNIVLAAWAAIPDDTHQPFKTILHDPC